MKIGPWTLNLKRITSGTVARIRAKHTVRRLNTFCPGKPRILPVPPDSSNLGHPGPDYFATTHWSVVLTAQRTDTTRAQAALARLCQTYWYPLYAFVRRQGHSPHDAQDLTQGFFARLLSGNFLAEIAPEKGNFRSFLLAALKHFLANEWDRAHAAKRGGGQPVISLDDTDAEERYRLEPVDNMTADKLFDRRWVMTLLEQVTTRLRSEYTRLGNAVLYEKLKDCLGGSRESAPYSQLAAELKMTEGAVKVAVHRLRARYRELLREEIAQTVTNQAEVDEEIRHLFSLLGG
jgi:DNA-directed RNA polymerase specialized sigma24 family protein